MRDSERLEEARKQGYLVYRRGRAERRRDEWYRDCAAAGRPFVTVRMGTRFATVEMDLFSTGFSVPEDEIESVHDLLQRYIIPPSRIGSGSLSISAGRVSADRAEELAQTLVRMADRWRRPAAEEEP